jgi:hypothetical protein
MCNWFVSIFCEICQLKTNFCILFFSFEFKKEIKLAINLANFLDSKNQGFRSILEIFNDSFLYNVVWRFVYFRRVTLFDHNSLDLTILVASESLQCPQFSQIYLNMGKLLIFFSMTVFYSLDSAGCHTKSAWGYTGALKLCKNQQTRNNIKKSRALPHSLPHSNKFNCLKS